MNIDFQIEGDNEFTMEVLFKSQIFKKKLR